VLVARKAVCLAVVLSTAAGVGACSSGPESTNWALVKAPDGAVLTLAVALGSSSCHRFVGFDVTESSDEVRVVAKFDRDSGGKACTSDLSTTSEEVRLAEPLGERRLTGCDSGIPQAPKPWGQRDDCRVVS
jgi:hypothetical protein